MKRILVFGAGGFIGHHLVRRLKNDGHWVCGVDLKYPEFSKTDADEFILGDLSLLETFSKIPNVRFNEIYQLAADMGGAEYIFTGVNDARIVHNSSLINLNTAQFCIDKKIKKVFFSSSACVYPLHNQLDPNNPICKESTAYPASPDSEYGWEKIFSERLYLSYARNYGLEVRIARFHNVYGPESVWQGGKEKSPAAICRKIILCEENGSIEIFGDGTQTRSFLYIDDCIDGVMSLMNSSYKEPVNIGSEEMISINGLADLVIKISQKVCNKVHIPGPIGVMGRCSDNTLSKYNLGWDPKINLASGISTTYKWIKDQILIGS